MQQIAAGSRFWWRAHDAPTPRPDAPAVVARPRVAGAAPSGPLWPQRATEPALSLTLAVPRGERRYRAQNRRPRRNSGAIAAAFVAVFALMATAFAITSEAIASIDFRSIAARQTRALMVAAGFGIDQVTITGHHFALDSDIFDALDLRNARTFADLDMAAALRRIERLSWVDTAQMTRIYPATLAIAVEERVPQMIWSRGDRHYLVDATGRVLGPVASGQSWKLPRVTGEGANTEASVLLAAISRQPDIASRMAFAERIGERRWRVVLKSGSRIELAADREAEGLDRIATRPSLSQSLTTAAYVADLRTPDRIALRPLGQAGADGWGYPPPVGTVGRR